MLEITVWDQPRVQEEESEFLGEVMYIAKIQVKCLVKLLKYALIMTVSTLCFDST